jgi:hypothetical protein
MAHKKKSKSFIRRLLTFNFRPESESIICRPEAGGQGPFLRYRREGGILVPVDNFPYDTWNSCMGIPEGEHLASADEAPDETLA